MPSARVGGRYGGNVLWRGRWLVGHVLVIGFAALFVVLGLWQLGRHREKQDAQEAAEAAFARPAPALDTLAPDAAPGARVEVAGTYDRNAQFLLRNRVRDGEGGFDVLTPLVLEDGTAVVVDRGWVARADAESAVERAEPPPGRVVVRGTIARSRPLSPADTVDERGGLVALPRVDLERIGRSLPYELQPVWVTAQYQDPPPADGTPALPEPPEQQRVNHLSYAFQWFGLALVPLVGWPIFLLRHRRHRTRDRRPARDVDAVPV